MTKPRTFRLFSVVSMRGRTRGSMEKFGLSKMACMIFVVCAATAIGAPAQTLTTLHSFDSLDGAFPNAGLVQGTNGELYGTTFRGGTSTACTFGCGTVFKITTTGKLTTLHSFDSTDGRWPSAGLIEATCANFYGTTFRGGTSTACTFGCGTVFQMTPEGTLTTLHSFDGKDSSFLNQAGLVQATDGKFYGITPRGGTGTNPVGTVFKITDAGTLTTLHSFDGNDGSSPQGALIQATDGNF